MSAYHTHCHRALELTPKKILQTLESLDAFRRPERFEYFLLACEADARGRTGFETRNYPQALYFRQAFELCNEITAAQVDTTKHKGKEIGEEIKRLRIKALSDFKAKQITN